MFKPLSTIALAFLVLIGHFTLADEPKSDKAGGGSEKRLKEMTVDLGKGINLEMVLIPAGEFMMGSPEADDDSEDEKPQHRVRITKPFYLGKYLVTQEQWQSVMGNNPSEFKGARNPVEKFEWSDCQDFLKKLNARFGAKRRKFLLPSEAQWEYACRAGSTTKYCFGDAEKKLGDNIIRYDDKKLGEYAWFDVNSSGRTHPVGEKKPNAWGLYDMHGNVFEWCQDRFQGDYYKNSPVDDPPGPSEGSDHVYRGGNWQSQDEVCRSAFRARVSRSNCDSTIGFRISLIPVDK